MDEELIVSLPNDPLKDWIFVIIVFVVRMVFERQASTSVWHSVSCHVKDCNIVFSIALSNPFSLMIRTFGLIEFGFNFIYILLKMSCKLYIIIGLHKDIFEI